MTHIPHPLTDSLPLSLAFSPPPSLAPSLLHPLTDSHPFHADTPPLYCLPPPLTNSLSFLSHRNPSYVYTLRDYVGGLADRKLEPDRRLSSEAERNWSEISTGQLRFDRRKEEAQALQNVMEGDLLRFFDR